MKYKVKIDCVLRNENQVNISAAGEINVTRVGGRNFHTCEPVYSYLRFNETAVMLLEPLPIIPGEFKFLENFEGPVFYTTRDFNATSACTTLMVSPSSSVKPDATSAGTTPMASTASPVKPERHLWLAICMCAFYICNQVVDT